MKVQEIKQKDFNSKIAKKGNTLIDCYAPWCGPCRRVGPIIEALAEDYEGQAIIGKCDVEEDEDLAARFGVRNIPTVFFIKGGEVVDKVVGAAARPVYEEKLKSLL